MEYIKNKKILLIIILGIILLISTMLYYIKDEREELEDITLLTTTKQITTKTEMIFVDIKGSVNKPGVYKFNINDRVIDAINKAGGLTKNANTNNINLSQKLTNEMVIYVYSDDEIKKGNNKLTCNTLCENNIIEVNNCVENTNKDLININTATLEELLTLPGIGESKAKSIIEYREENKFKNIEELMNVNGIGESLFEQIKNKITI